MGDDIILSILLEVQRELGIAGDGTMLGEIEARLRRKYGGCEVYIPARATAERDRRLIEAWRKGATTSQLAARFGLSERHVRRIINTRRKR